MTPQQQTSALVDAVLRQGGGDFRGLRMQAMQHRLEELARRSCLTGLDELARLAVEDAGWTARVAVSLGIPPSPWFGDGAFYRSLRQEVAPLLRTHPSVRLWLPACSTGEAAYALAVTLREERLERAWRIYATDASETALAVARQGVYPAASIASASAAYLAGGGRASLSEYFEIEGDQAVMRPALRETIWFAPHNLATDASFNEFQLVVCRDALSQFQPALRERALNLMHESLYRFGFLALGPEDPLPRTQTPRSYRALPGGVGLYRRLG